MAQRRGSTALSIAAVALVFIAGSAAGCASGPRVRLRVTPPAPEPPPIAPVDADHDGVSDDRDPCPLAEEDGLPPETDDGCPAR